MSEESKLVDLLHRLDAKVVQLEAEKIALQRSLEQEQSRSSRLSSEAKRTSLLTQFKDILETMLEDWRIAKNAVPILIVLFLGKVGYEWWRQPAAPPRPPYCYVVYEDRAVRDEKGGLIYRDGELVTRKRNWLKRVMDEKVYIIGSYDTLEQAIETAKGIECPLTEKR